MTVGRERGVSLTELLLVVLLLAILSLVVMPDMAPGRDAGVELAAGEVADALRFARAESLRTGVPHGLRVHPDNKRFVVFQLETKTKPYSELYTVRHPLSKSLYDYDVEDRDVTRAVRLNGHFSYANPSAVLVAVSFDERGEPGRSSDLAPLLTGGVIVESDLSSVAVAVSALTGQVTVGAVGGPVPDPASVFDTPIEFSP